jgi:histidine triad (HIT) family protein
VCVTGDYSNAARLLHNRNVTGCLFCQIVSGFDEASMVLDDELTLAFLDHRPLFPGHCLLIPKQHYETLADVPAELITPLFSNAQVLCRAVELVMHAEGSFLAINNRVSQSVPHVHIHIVPRRKKDGLRGFFWPRGKYRDADEQQEVAGSVREAVESLKKSPAV